MAFQSKKKKDVESWTASKEGLRASTEKFIECRYPFYKHRIALALVFVPIFAILTLEEEKRPPHPHFSFTKKRPVLLRADFVLTKGNLVIE